MSKIIANFNIQMNGDGILRFSNDDSIQYEIPEVYTLNKAIDEIKKYMKYYSSIVYTSQDIVEAFDDVWKQLIFHENETAFGEPQAFIETSNGRTIEVTLEKEGLAVKDEYYSVRLHCSNEEFENDVFHSTNGIIGSYCSDKVDLKQLRKSLIDALYAAENL